MTMFDFKKTIMLFVVVVTIVMATIAGFCTGRMIGYDKGVCDAQYSQYDRLVSQDSLLRKQTELCHRLMDKLYDNNSYSILNK